MYVFLNGKAFGVNLGFRKCFTLEYGLRVGFNCLNGIIGNNHLGWLDISGLLGSNRKGGGYAAGNTVALLNL